MVLIKSISGIRGTLENIPGQSLSDQDISEIILSYIEVVVNLSDTRTVIIGRDARPSGIRISELITQLLIDNGVDVIDLGLATTPTIGISVKEYKASGAIIISASHNGIEWNALKLLNNKGEFLTEEISKKVIDHRQIKHKLKESKGKYLTISTALEKHIKKILALDVVNQEAIKLRNYSVVIDGINSVGGIALPMLLTALGVNKIKKINCTPNGNFAHNPEPLPENIFQIKNLLKSGSFDFGIVVDPDVDRLCFVDEKGNPFGEEYTLVLAAKHVLEKKKENVTCSNLSSSMALPKVTESLGGRHYFSAVGEINVVREMKKTNAIIGGEGNGGVIYPEIHYGRDALVGIGIILSYIAEKNLSLSQIKKTLPQYFMSKKKITFIKDFELILDKLKKEYVNDKIITIDGLKVMKDNEWFHIRKSNTEPIVRVYTEAPTLNAADMLAQKIIEKIKIL